MDFTILEARHFVSSHEGFVSRTVKDYELDMECASNRIYSYGPMHIGFSMGIFCSGVPAAWYTPEAHRILIC